MSKFQRAGGGSKFDRYQLKFQIYWFCNKTIGLKNGPNDFEKKSKKW